MLIFFLAEEMLVSQEGFGSIGLSIHQDVCKTRNFVLKLGSVIIRAI
jgi:hypothetical protein